MGFFQARGLEGVAISFSWMLPFKLGVGNLLSGLHWPAHIGGSGSRVSSSALSLLYGPTLKNWKHYKDAVLLLLLSVTQSCPTL